LHIDHFRNRRYLDAYVDGELTGGLAARVAGHVADCPMCGREQELTMHVKESLARRRRLTERAADRLRRWARRELSERG
jgi:anti-sigma factor RsiW